MMKQFSYSALCIALGCAVLCGCERDSEKVNLKLSDAIAAESTQNYDVAEELYRGSIREVPADALAHLNLALLLHNHRKDYLGALHHYQSYLDLEPMSEKAALVKQHLDAVVALYRAEVAREDILKHQTALTRERDLARKELLAAKEEIDTLEGSVAEKAATIKTLESKVASLERMIDELKSVPVTPMVIENDLEKVKTMADEIAKPVEVAEEKPIEEVAAVEHLSIDEIRAMADAMINEEDGGQEAVNEATRLATEGLQDEDTILAVPTSGQYYMVRPSDTYISIARTAYGSAARWKEIRDKNRGPTNPDDRLRAGEVIFIP